MSLEYFEYNGLKLTEPEIRLLKLVESRRSAHRLAEEEKRAERLLLSQSLQASMLTGLQLDLEKKSEAVEAPAQHVTHVPTNEELAAMREEHLPQHEDRYEGEDEGDESDAMDVAEDVGVTSSTSSSTIKIPKKSKPSAPPIISSSDETKATETSTTQTMDTELTSTAQSGGTSSNAEVRIRKKQRLLTDPAVDTTAPKTFGLDSIFSVEGLLAYEDWSPKISKNASLLHLLPNFSLDGNQTVALKLSVIPTNGRWSVNICPEDPLEMVDVYMHFNPRYKTNEVVLNDVQGTWGGPYRRPMTGRMSALRSTALEVVIQVRREGYCVFANGSFLTLFPHRRDPFKRTTLSLLVPATDGMGHPEDLVVHKVWWGRVVESALAVPASILQQSTASQYAGDDESGGPSAGPSDYRWDRTVLVSGLPPFTDPVEVYELEKALYTLFADYAPEAVLVVGGKGLAYTRLSNRETVLEAAQALEGSLVADFTLHMEPGPSNI